ncbi:Fic family protein [Helicobacter sp. NHP22-001]|uniref:Fic family protein n=1 Tax=Helicobacter sp. NHP22-001 TaxID=3040202 RepID=UPI0025539C98|nr:Fic family protein [Helicobacter sp. NHP22-001]
MKEFIPKELPPNFTPDAHIYKLLIRAHAKLGELKGVAKIIPNQNILINSLVLQEAKESSAIENIITTHDELFLAQIEPSKMTKNAKEVQNYAKALRIGFALIQKEKILRNKHILETHRELEGNDAGFRTQKGTKLKNPLTGQIKHIPPQNNADIKRLMGNLECYINEDMDSLDPLIKLAIIHYQFEAIHPFYDGNGRCGRILNILYLTHQGLLDLPILYLSAYIIKYKDHYYELLAQVGQSGDFGAWVAYILEGVAKSAEATIHRVKKIQQAMRTYQQILQKRAPKIYSKDLIEILFSHPYTKIEFLESRLNIHRHTASTYLKECENLKMLHSIKKGRNKYLVNVALFSILSQELIC